SYKDQRDRQELPARIEKLEAEIADLHAALCDVLRMQKDPAARETAQTRLAAAESELETAFTRWAEVEERAERLGLT
ncbi:MAG: ABC transporter ATP-binding protein, partial [Clostridia bacterium]|nr:ABC transporter ATP-binding protein [Clostridia bacterium]